MQRVAKTRRTGTIRILAANFTISALAQRAAPNVASRQTNQGPVMHRVQLTAGSSIAFTATSRAGVALHRWDIEMYTVRDTTDGCEPRFAYGSRVGGRDDNQRVDIPAQSEDFELQISSRHAVGEGWEDDACVVGEDSPALLTLGFTDASLPSTHRDDVTLSFAFKAPNAEAGL